jgi:NADPH:quinone reductase-like Zn-dependent oxidoreductase
VEPDGGQLAVLPELDPQIDSSYPLDQFATAFDRSEQRGKRGKVVLRVA